MVSDFQVTIKAHLKFVCPPPPVFFFYMKYRSHFRPSRTRGCTFCSCVTDVTVLLFELCQIKQQPCLEALPMKFESFICLLQSEAAQWDQCIFVLFVFWFMHPQDSDTLCSDQPKRRAPRFGMLLNWFGYHQQCGDLVAAAARKLCLIY